MILIIFAVQNTEGNWKVNIDTVLAL